MGLSTCIHYFIACFLSFAYACFTLEPTASLLQGTVIGKQIFISGAQNPVDAFLGLPYQAPPRRFAIPSAAAPWSTPINASSFRDACIQQYSSSFLSQFAQSTSSRPSTSEDCLYMNIWRPGKTAPVQGWPIIVWIHGGGLQFGSANEAVYNGAALASTQDVVVVSFNYRLNVFGFPGSPDLPLNQSNLGFLDQRFALRWIQDNISRFNGNPSIVTIMGESSGAVSVDALLTCPPQEALFNAAIAMSGTAIGNTLSEIGQDAQTPWKELANDVGCQQELDQLECVRQVPVTAIQAFLDSTVASFIPVVDHVTLTNNATRKTGTASRVPLLIGTVRNEGTLFTAGVANLTAYVDNLFGAFPDLASKVLSKYSVGQADVPDEKAAIAQIFGDVGLKCPAAIVANESRWLGVPTWRYEYDSLPVNETDARLLGVYHSSELPLLFGNYPEKGRTAKQNALSAFLQSAWGAFARNPSGGPGWPLYGAFDGTDVASIGAGLSSGVTMRTSREVDRRCAVFQDIYTLLGV